MNKKSLLLSTVILILCTVPVYAQDEPPIPEVPADNSYVLDTLDWLSTTQEAEINNIIKQLDNDGLAEIAVVTLNDCGTDKTAFRKSLFDTWGIGHTNDNDGLLILVCWYGGDTSRRSVEQLFGPGLNVFLTSDRTDQIMQDNFIPEFQQEQPGAGLIAMVHIYDAILRTSSTSRSENSQSSIEYDYPSIIFTAVSVSIIFFLLLYLMVKMFRGKKPNSHYRRKGKRNSKRSGGNLWWIGGDGGSSGYDGGGGFDGGGSDGGGGSSSDF